MPCDKMFCRTMSDVKLKIDSTITITSMQQVLYHKQNVSNKKGRRKSLDKFVWNEKQRKLGEMVAKFLTFPARLSILSQQLPRTPGYNHVSGFKHEHESDLRSS